MAELKKAPYEGRVSIHDSVEEMMERIRADGMTNAFDRYRSQEKIRCKYCLQGLSCKLCSNGPCRISDRGPQDKGVCGIGPDAMAMRDFLLHNVMGLQPTAITRMKPLEPSGQQRRVRHRLNSRTRIN